MSTKVTQGKIALRAHRAFVVNLPLPAARSPSARLQLQGGRVDAVAESGRRWAVGEDVAEVAATAAACDLGPGHEVAPVLVLGDLIRADRPVEAGPAGSRVELGIGREELLAA